MRLMRLVSVLVRQGFFLVGKTHMNKEYTRVTTIKMTLPVRRADFLCLVLSLLHASDDQAMSFG